jgi:hypothetical protein
MMLIRLIHTIFTLPMTIVIVIILVIVTIIKTKKNPEKSRKSTDGYAYSFLDNAMINIDKFCDNQSSIEKWIIRSLNLLTWCLIIKIIF